MNTTEINDLLQTLENIELLAQSGGLGNPLTGLMALLLRHEIEYANTREDALERAARFIVECEQITVAKAS